MRKIIPRRGERQRRVQPGDPIHLPSPLHPPSRRKGWLGGGSRARGCCRFMRLSIQLINFVSTGRRSRGRGGNLDKDIYVRFRVPVPLMVSLPSAWMLREPVKSSPGKT